MIIYCEGIAKDEQTLICCGFWPQNNQTCKKHPESGPRLKLSPTFLEFQDALGHILSHMTPFSLHLGIVTNVSNAEMARRLLEPLNSISTLADCAIHLCKQYDPDLISIARRYALQAMGKSSIETLFRIMDLPRELRLQILESTDLVIGVGEVEWSPKRGYRLNSGSNACGPEHLFYSRYLSDPFLKQGFFCQMYNCGFSRHCHCWSPPAALFLSSRALRDEALATFFGNNRFVVVPTRGCPLPAYGTADRLEVSIFLREVVPVQALPCIQFLEIVFLPFDGNFLAPNEPAYQDWIELLDFLSDKLTPSRLTLRIYFSDYDIDGYCHSDYRVHMTPAKYNTIIQAYDRTLRPLKKLPGVHPSWQSLVLGLGRNARDARVSRA